MAKISGNKLNNTLVGTVNDDIINGLDGNDRLIGSNGNDKLYGGNGQDVLKGGNGNDVLDGGKGADVMDGGAGEDHYYVDNSNDMVVESVKDNIFFDVVTSAVNYVLPANIENLQLVGARSINGTGNELNNVITGNSRNNTLLGLDGNDRLDGGKGADVMTGGKGADTYVVDNAKDSIIEENENHSSQRDHVITSVSYTLPAHVEDLSTNGKSLKVFGNDLNNQFTDYVGNNILSGGAGDDTYHVYNKNIVVIESTTIMGGVDTVVVHDSYTLPNGVENLEMINFFQGTQGNGNSLDNKIYGGTGNNILRGFDGNDLLNGEEGNDKLFGGNGDDILIAGSAVDLIRLTDFDYRVLNSSNTIDLLSGGNGNDLLVCELDHFNQLIGGAGQDTFSFNINEFTTTTRPLTEISDFKSGTDVIDLRAIVASGGHFLSFIGTNAFSSSNADGQVRFDAANHQLLGSIDSDAAPEFAISLLGVNSLSANDLILK